MYFMNFSDNVKWSPKNMWKADGKANVKQQEIKDHLVVVSYKFLSEVLSKHKKIPCKKCVLSFKKRGWDGAGGAGLVTCLADKIC